MRENRVKAENRCKCVLKVLSKMKTKTKREGRGEKDQEEEKKINLHT